MSDVVITVRGEHEARIAPEQATVHLTLRAEGPERGAVVERISALSEPVRDDLISRKSAGNVAEWTSRRVSIWSERPWNNEGKRLAPVHYATVEFSATFTDFAALSWWVGDVAEREEVQLSHIDWRLTPETRTATERDVASAAVGVAVARATAYAEAIGLASVVPLEIADLGLLTRADAPESAPAETMRLAKAFASDAVGSAGGGVQLQPEEIVVSAAVEARFAAR